MERVSKNVPQFDIRSYYMLTKPGIIFGNVVTMGGGFALAAKGSFSFILFLMTLIGLSMIIASSCIFNNYIDRDADQKMARTKNRPSATGKILVKSAITFSIFLGITGALLLYFFVNPLTALLSLVGFFVYVVPYSFLKYHTVHGTLIGSIAGALPPVIGYCAVSNSFDLGALLIFLIIALWQMPHFFAIALFRLEDYKAANIPVLPVKRGVLITKIQMLLYVILFMGSCTLLTLFHYTSYSYLIITIVLSFGWVALSIRGFFAPEDRRWAREMFAYSLFVVMAICIMIPFTVV